MKPPMKAVACVIAAALGVGASFVWAPAGVALSFVGLVFGQLVMFGLNVGRHRAVFVLAALAHGWTVAHGSGSWWLGAAVLPGPLALPPYETLVRALGFKGGKMLPAASALGFGLLLASWPPGPWWLAAAPVLLGSAFLSRRFVTTFIRWRGWKRDAWALAVGDEVPELRLKARRDNAEFSLHAQRGRFVLLQFVRGDWCPVCHVMMRILKREAANLAAHQVKVVVIGPGDGTDADDVVLELGLDYAVLSDPTHAAAKLFGSFDTSAFDGRGAPIPAAFLVGPDGTLRHGSRPDDVQQFYDPREVIDIIRAEPALA